MIDVAHLALLADEYARVTSTKDVTLSFWVFNDSKKLAAIRSGADITVGRYNAALRWFSERWPESAVWPEGVQRPIPEPTT